MDNKSLQTVDRYIGSFPQEIQKVLADVRKVIKETAPAAEESIAYGMPAYKLNGKPLAYFAAFKNHTGFYPLPHVIEAFKDELTRYKHAKGSIQFPLNETIPLELIKKIIMFRIQESNSR
ncbi:MAG: DUF1801 domain-containing protein [Patescibacteria group bacterium]|jgi:uncharacterized protein YdhG (YjbR/CyaY superfamily)